MTEVTMTDGGVVMQDGHARVGPKLDSGFDAGMDLILFSVLALALLFIAYSIYVDVNETGVPATTWLAYLLLEAALFVALGFEFVHGLHDTANALAMVIYPHRLGGDASIFERIRAGDPLLFHPDDGLARIERLISTAVADPDTIAIEMTVYRIDDTAFGRL